MTIDRTGCARVVLLTRRYAIKVPNFFDWRLFLHGLLANMQERNWSQTGWSKFCPVLFSLRGGWLVVMPRVTLLTDAEFIALDFEAWRDDTENGYYVPCEGKSNSLGWYQGRVVAIDYGN